MAVNGVELKIGQRWMTGSGDVGILRKTDAPHYPWALDLEDGSWSYTYTEDGEYDIEYVCAGYNLSTLLGDSATESDKYSLEEDPEYTEYLRLKNKFEIKDKN